MRFWGVLLILAMTAGAGCNSPPEGSAPDPQAALQPGLATSMQVEVTAGVVRLSLHVTNPTREPVRLEFPTAQRYDFAVRTKAGAEVWRWSADQMFAQVVGHETVPGSGSEAYRVEWQPGARSGEFIASGWLTSAGGKIEQHAEFELPAR